MRQTIIGLLIIALVASFAIGCSNGSKEQSAMADKLVETAYLQKDYEHLLAITDSLEQSGSFPKMKADYWRGYAFDRMKQPEKAEEAWKSVLTTAEKSGDKADMDIYVKAASRLANMLTIKGDYEGTLKYAVPAVERLEVQQCDTTSDYVNLLIYIGCCQAVMGKAVGNTDHGFYRAYQKHLENIERKHSDASYKDAIAGLINIAYYCVQARKFEDALYYTRNFGELLGEYEQRPGVSAEYVDRQLGRYDIYKAQALNALGQKAEADKVFEAFQATEYSKTPEGLAQAQEFVNMYSRVN